MPKIVFSDEDAKTISEKFGNPDLEEIRDFLDEIEECAYYNYSRSTKDEILDLILGKPRSWKDYVPSLYLRFWNLDKAEGAKYMYLYEDGGFYVIKVDSDEVAKDFDYIYDLGDIGGDGILIHWRGEFEKVDDIGNVYLVVTYEDARERIPIIKSWFGNKEDAIKYVKE
jgi:hypothetical protein